MKVASLICRKCGAFSETAHYLREITSWFPRIGVLGHHCGICGHTEEIQIAHGKIIQGYIYAAGTPHFAAMEEIDVPGLDGTASPEQFEIRLDGDVWYVLAKT